MQPPRRLGTSLWPRSLGNQLRLAFALVLWLTIVGYGAHTLRAATSAAERGFDEQATALARNLALASENAIVTDELDVLEMLVRRAADHPQVMDVRIVDPRGAVLSHARRDGRPSAGTVFDPPSNRVPLPPQPQPLLQRDSDAALVQAWHPVVAGTLIAWVRVDQSTQTLRALRETIWRDTVIACLLAGLGAAAVLQVLLRAPLRAIERATNFAQGLQSVDGQQLAALEGPTETRTLGAALNQASTQLFGLRQEVLANLARLRRQEAALANTNQQLQTIFALSPDGLVSFDAAGLVNFANPAFLRITGLAADAVLGQPLDTLDALLREASSRTAVYESLAGCFHAAQASEAADTAAPRRRLTLMQPQLTVLELAGRVGDTDAVSRLLYVRDITHESEVDRMKSEFLATAAHELRTPLTSIHACVELLLSREFSAERRHHLLSISQRQSLVLVTLVNELLDLGRIESRRDADFEFECLDLADVVGDVLRDFAPPSGRAPPSLQQDDTPLLVRVDRKKTAQVLRNLLSNAYKYSQGGEVQLQLLGCEHDPRLSGRVGLAVQDHGIGMSREQLSRVFERFYRADPAGHVPGTGLGMSIVRELVGLMDGEVVLRSSPGEGTTATVWLPRHAAATHAASADAPMDVPAYADSAIA
jgi:two-component system, OmpR family, sensor histidine kinase VicK